MPSSPLGTDHGSVATLKPDLEAAGEHRLATMEIEALLGGRLVSGTGSHELVLPELSAAEVELLTRRLAFTDHVTIGGVRARCAQASLERRYGELLDLRRREVSGATRKRNEYLTHGFHKYKAKFFPRMARALINITCGVNGVVLDPFVGSGTTLVEAATMNIRAMGVDIDPLSVFIARQKLDVLSTGDGAAFAERLLRFLPNERFSWRQPQLFSETATEKGYTLPRYIRIKLGDSLAAEIEMEVWALLGAIRAIDDQLIRGAGMLALSHALATKVNLRWMGTGDNRFSLSVGKSRIVSIFARHVRTMARALRSADTLPDSCAGGSGCHVVEGSALSLPFADESVDGIVTSPPYVPASSGRETYLRSRGPSLVALNLLSEQELVARETRMMGSILNAGVPGELPGDVARLVQWMMPQRARAPKARATATYFGELRVALSEMARVLKPGGKVALVLATTHTYYDLVSRQTVRTLNMPVCVRGLLEVGARLPLHHVDTVEVELAKMDFAARPGARGKYSESIVFFRKRAD